MLNTFGHPVEWCWTFLATLLNDVERVWPPCWMMLNVFGDLVEWCWTRLAILLNDVQRVWPHCWMTLNAFLLLNDVDSTFFLFLCENNNVKFVGPLRSKSYNKLSYIIEGRCSVLFTEASETVQQFHSTPFDIVEFALLYAFGHPVKWCWMRFEYIGMASDTAIKLSYNKIVFNRDGWYWIYFTEAIWFGFTTLSWKVLYSKLAYYC